IFEEWRVQAHEIIDKFCQEKHNQYIESAKEEFDHIRDTITLLINNHNRENDYLHWIKQTIQSIEQNLDDLKNFQYKFAPLEIDSSIIRLPSSIIYIKHPASPMNDFVSPQSSPNNSVSPEMQVHSYCFSLSTRNSLYPWLISPKRIIKLPSDNWYSLATNQTYILVIGKSTLYLINQHFKSVNQKSFSQEGIKDICWSKTLNRFILISPKEIFSLHEKRMILDPCQLYFNSNIPWKRGICSETSLFSSTFGQNPFIVEFNLCPSNSF
ncbi:unnamed protein product, partial [Rotaria sp. Silwood2]